MKLQFAGLATLAVVLSACGTTVSTAVGLSDHPLDSGGERVAGGQPATGTAAGSGHVSPGPQGTGSASARAPGGRPGTTTAETAGPSSRAAALSEWRGGLTSREIRIGLVRLKDFTNPAGIRGAERSSAQQIAEAITADINAHGGVAGRRLVLEWFDVRQTDDVNTISQGTCEAFVRDHPVFVAVAADTPQVRGCLGAKHLPMFGTGYANASQEALDANPYLAYLGQINLTRLRRAQVDGLVGSGFLTRSAEIGFVDTDNPDHRNAFDKGLVPQLARHGLRLKDHVSVTDPQSQADIAVVANQLANAVLKFRTEGIDHVLFGAAAYTFMQSAQSQGYYPKYGLTSLDNPQTLALNAPDAKRQLEGAAGVGYMPEVDVADYQRAADSPARRRCFGVLAGAGLRPESASDASLMVLTCDALYLIQHAADAAGKDLTGASFMRALESTGGGFRPAGTFLAHYDARHRDGGGTVRLLSFDQGCTCFRYAGKDVRVG